MDSKSNAKNGLNTNEEEKYHPLIVQNTTQKYLLDIIDKIDAQKKFTFLNGLTDSFKSILSCFKCYEVLKAYSVGFNCGHKYCKSCGVNLKSCISCEKGNIRHEIKDFSNVLNVIDEIKSNFNLDRIMYEMIKFLLLPNKTAVQDNNALENVLKLTAPEKPSMSNDASTKKSKTPATKSNTLKDSSNKNENSKKKTALSKENSIDHSVNIIENDSENLFMETAKSRKANGKKMQSYLEQQPSVSNINDISTSGGKIKRKRKNSDETPEDGNKEKLSKRIKKERRDVLSMSNDSSKKIKCKNSEPDSPDSQNPGTFSGFFSNEIEKSRNKLDIVDRLLDSQKRCEPAKCINKILFATGESKAENAQNAVIDMLEAVKSMVQLEAKPESTLISARNTDTEELDLDVWKREDKYERKKSLFKSIKERKRRDSTIDRTSKKTDQNQSETEKPTNDGEPETAIQRNEILKKNIGNLAQTISTDILSPSSDKENKPADPESPLFLDQLYSSTPFYEMKKVTKTYSKAKGKLFGTPCVDVSPIVERETDKAMETLNNSETPDESKQIKIVVQAEIHDDPSTPASFKTPRPLRSRNKKLKPVESPVQEKIIKLSNADNSSEIEQVSKKDTIQSDNELVLDEDKIMEPKSDDFSEIKQVLDENSSIPADNSQEKRAKRQRHERKSKVKNLQENISNKNEKTLANLKKNFQINSPKQLTVERVKNHSSLESTKNFELNLTNPEQSEKTQSSKMDVEELAALKPVDAMNKSDFEILNEPELELMNSKKKVQGYSCSEALDSSEFIVPSISKSNEQIETPSKNKSNKSNNSESSLYGEELPTQKRSPWTRSIGCQTTSDLHMALLKQEFPHLFEKLVTHSVYDTPVESSLEVKTPENGALKADSKYTAISSITSSEKNLINDKDFMEQSVLGESIFSEASANKTAISGYAPLSPDPDSSRNEKTVVCRLNFQEPVLDDTLKFDDKNESNEIEFTKEVKNDEESYLSVSILDSKVQSEPKFGGKSISRVPDTDSTICEGAEEENADSTDEDDTDFVAATPTSIPRRSITSSIEKINTPLETANRMDILIGEIITPKNVTPLSNYNPKDVSQMSGIRKQNTCSNEFTPVVEPVAKELPKVSLELFNSIIADSPVNVPLHITTSGLKEVDMKLVKRFCDTFSANLLDKLTERTTHLVVKAGEDNTTNRTFKYLQAIVNGVVIVSLKWIEACVAENKVMDEEKFIPLDSSKECGPLRTFNVMKGLTPSPLSWLKEYCIYFIEPVPEGCTLFQLQDIMRKIGSTVVNNIRDFKKYPDHHRVIIFSDEDENDDSSHMKIAEWLQTYQAVSVEFNWILEVIGRNRLIPFAKYEVLEIPDDYLKQLNFPAEMLELENDDEDSN